MERLYAMIEMRVEVIKLMHVFTNGRVVESLAAIL